MFDFDSATGELFLYDDIGPAWLGMIDAGAVMNAMKDWPSEERMTVRINSPGGSVDEGIAIHNMLRRHQGGVDVVVDSLAASIASYIALAGDTVTIAENGMFMVHAPWMLAAGNATELREAADTLDKYQMRIESAYKKRMQLSDEELAALMATETWYTAEEAIAAGLADRMDGPTDEVVAVAKGRFKNTPAAYVADATPGSRTPYNHDRKRYEYQAARYTSKKTVDNII